MLEALEFDYNKEPLFLKSSSVADPFLLMAGSTDPSIKRHLFAVLSQLEIPLHQLSHTDVNAYGIHCVGLLYQHPDPKRCLALEALLRERIISL